MKKKHCYKGLFVLAMLLITVMSVPASAKTKYVYLNKSIPKKIAANCSRTIKRMQRRS